MYSPYTPPSSEPTIHANAIRPGDCFRDGVEMIKDQYWLFVGITFVAGLLTGFSCGILSAAMASGVAMCLVAKARRQYVQFELLFKGFSFFAPTALILVVWIALYLVTSAPNIVFAVASNPVFNKSAPPPGLSTTLISYAIQIVTTFVQQILQGSMLIACLFVVERGLPAIEAIKSCGRLVTSNLGPFIALTLLTTVASLIGVVACCVGVIFVTPIIQAALAMSYLQCVPDAQAGAPGGYAPPPPNEYRPPYG